MTIQIESFAREKDSMVEISDDLNYVGEPVRIVNHRIRQLRKHVFPMVRVLWKYLGVKETTWKTAEEMRQEYPHLFFVLDTQKILGTKFLFRRGEM